MLLLTRNRLRNAATALTAGALAATTLAFAGAPAQAAEPAAPELSWAISEQFVGHLATRTLSDGAAYADETFAFPLEDVVESAGSTAYHYGGTVKGAFAMGGTEYYSVTVTDPIVTVDGSGAGEITAVVSAANVAAQGNPAESTEPARATVAEFTGGTIADGALTAVPNWAGVLPAGDPRATELAIPAEKPVDGQAFHPDFLARLTTGTRSHFYATGSASDAKKAPAQIVAATPVPTVTASAAFNGDYLDVAIAGTNFDPTWRPGAMGIYATFGPQQDLFDLSADGEGDALDRFPDSAWITAAEITDGAWSTTIPVDRTKLVKGVQYAVYTWTAHGNPTAGDPQYTETLLPISGLPKSVAKLKSKVAKAPTSKKAGKLKVTVKGHELVTPTGKVKITLKKGKATKKAKGTLNKNGIAKIKLPKVAKGTWKLTANYTGDANYRSATKGGKVAVKK